MAEKKMITPTTMYLQKKAYMTVVVLLLIGGFNWLSVGLLQVDIVQKIFGRRILGRLVYVLVGLAAVWLAMKRDFYLPFLGESILPAEALTKKVPTNANQVYTIKVTPGAKVVYWASEPVETTGLEAGKLNDWNVAYKNNENSGVAVADEAGNAVLRIRGPPQSYNVPLKGRIEPHIHFRVAGEFGMMGPVQMYYVKSGSVEPFTV